MVVITKRMPTRTVRTSVTATATVALTLLIVVSLCSLLSAASIEKENLKESDNQDQNAIRNQNYNTVKPKNQGMKLALGQQANAESLQTDSTNKLSVSQSRGKVGVRVAVIGGGISGASAAYFLRRYLDPAATELEAKTYREFEMYRSLTERAGGRVTLPRTPADYMTGTQSGDFIVGHDSQQLEQNHDGVTKYSGLTIDVFEKSSELGGRLQRVFQKPKWNLTKSPFLASSACVDANRKANPYVQKTLSNTLGPDSKQGDDMCDIDMCEDSSLRSDLEKESHGRGFVDTCPPNTSDKFSEDVAVEAGPFEFPASNEMLLSIAQDLGLEAISSPSSKERTALRNESETLYESSTWPTVTLARLVWRYGLAVPKLKELVGSFIQRFRSLYGVLGGQSNNAWDGFCFGTIEELLQAADPILLSSTQISLIDALKIELGEDQAVDRLINEVVASLTRAQLNQTPFIHALAGYMSLVPALGTTDNFALRGGVSRLIEALLHVSGSLVRLNSRVIAIEAVDRRDSLHIHKTQRTQTSRTLGNSDSRQANEKKSSHPFEYRVSYIDEDGKVFHRCYDYVIVATPFPLSGPSTAPSPSLSNSYSSLLQAKDIKGKGDSKFGTLAGLFPSIKERHFAEEQRASKANTASNLESVNSGSNYRALVSHLITSSIGHATGSVASHRNAHHGSDADGGNIVNVESMRESNRFENEAYGISSSKDHPIILGPEFPRHQFVKKLNPFEVTYVTLLQGVPNATYFESHLQVESSIADDSHTLKPDRSDHLLHTTQSNSDQVDKEKPISSNSEVDIETFASLRELLGLQVEAEDLLTPGLIGEKKEKMLRVVEAALPSIKTPSEMSELPGILLTTEPRSLTAESVYAAFVRSQVALGLPGTPHQNGAGSKSQARLLRAQAMARQAGLAGELELPDSLKLTDTELSENPSSVPMLVSIHLTSMVVLRRHQLRIAELVEHAITRRRNWIAKHYSALEAENALESDKVLGLLREVADQSRRGNVRDSSLNENLEMWRVRLTSRGPLSREFIQRIFPVRSPGALQFAWFSHPRLTSQARFESLRLRLNPQRASRRRGPIFESSEKNLVGATVATGARNPGSLNKPFSKHSNSDAPTLSNEIASRVFYVSAAEEAMPFVEFMLLTSQNIAKLVARDVLDEGADSTPHRNSLNFEASSPYSRVSEVQRSFSPESMWSDEVDLEPDQAPIPSLPVLQAEEAVETSIAETYETVDATFDVGSVPRLRQLMRPILSGEVDPTRLLEIQIPSDIIQHDHHSHDDPPIANSFTIKAQDSSRLQETMSSQQPKVVIPSRLHAKSVLSNVKIDNNEEISSGAIAKQIVSDKVKRVEPPRKEYSQQLPRKEPGIVRKNVEKGKQSLANASSQKKETVIPSKQSSIDTNRKGVLPSGTKKIGSNVKPQLAPKITNVSSQKLPNKASKHTEEAIGKGKVKNIVKSTRGQETKKSKQTPEPRKIDKKSHNHTIVAAREKKQLSSKTQIPTASTKKILNASSTRTISYPNSIVNPVPNSERASRLSEDKARQSANETSINRIMIAGNSAEDSTQTVKEELGSERLVHELAQNHKRLDEAPTSWLSWIGFGSSASEESSASRSYRSEL